MVKLVVFVAVTASGAQPVVLFKVNSGVNGGSIQICNVLVVVPQKF